MKRSILLIGLICAGFFVAPMVSAQDVDVRVKLFALSEFPLLREELYVRNPTAPSEYKRLTRWNLDKWRDRSPEFFDLVAIMENTWSISVGPIELHLTRDVKIGEHWDWINNDPDPRVFAQWTGPIPVETKTIGPLDADAATSIWFGPFSADELLQDHSGQDLWPWEVRFEVTLRCNACSPTTGIASFEMIHPH